MCASNRASLLATGLAAAFLCGGLAACGGSAGAGDEQAAASPGPTASDTPRPRKKATSARPTPPSDGGISKTALLRKMRKDPEVQGLPDTYVTCMADLAMKYGDKKDLRRYIDGAIKSDDVKGLTPSNKRFWNEADKCVQ
ncbi:hypothetical protein [Nonomuraea angiospora]|uniref:hypothetical protein n=1 Tax=Nonomuraea angiospora TaxID=46172 RepID=UPI0029A95C9D|nr:hypothetical protein [Nonomuraea angiospora]MDX3101505.1 hypothetical protein [Nonomuraea angiospora]